MHPRRVPPDEERLLALVRLVDEVERPGEELLVDRLHPLPGQRAGVLDLLLADRPEVRGLLRVVLVRRPGVEDAARAEPLAEVGVLLGLRVVRVLRLLLGVQVVEVAEELVEAVDGRQVLVAVAEVVLAELAADVPVRLEQVGDRRVEVGEPLLRARQAHLGQARADGRLAGDEGGAAGGAGLLPVPVGEHRALTADPVDVRRAVAHRAVVVGADVPPPDVVAPDDEDVGLVLRHACLPLG